MTTNGIAATVAAYSIQVLLVLGLGLPLPWLLGLKRPDFRFRYYSLLLGAILLLPVLGSLPLRVPALTDSPVLQFESIVRLSEPASNQSLVIPGILLILAGIILFRLMAFALGLVRLRAISGSASPLEQVPPEVARLRSQLCSAATIAISDQFSVPVSFGWRRPHILVPTTFFDLDAEGQEAVICHELLHLKRGDWLCILFEQLAGSVLWFHPAVHLLLDRINLSREQLIDREVIRETGRPRVYLETLKETAETFRQASVAPTIPFIRVCHLKARVAALKEEAFMSKSRLLLLGFVLLSSLVLLSAAALAIVPLVGSGIPGPSGPALLSSVSGVQDQGKSEKKEGQVNVSDEVDVHIKLVKKVNPVYPEEAKKEGITGAVVLRITIAKTGKVTETKVIESPHDLLSKSAIDAVSQWEYEPPTKNGEPVSAKADVTIRFELK